MHNFNNFEELLEDFLTTESIKRAICDRIAQQAARLITGVDRGENIASLLSNQWDDLNVKETILHELTNYVRMHNQQQSTTKKFFESSEDISRARADAITALDEGYDYRWSSMQHNDVYADIEEYMKNRSAQNV